MSKPPETILLSEDQYNGLIQKAEKKELSGEDLELLVVVLKAYRMLMDILKYKKTTIQKLKDMLFGQRTEKNKSPQDKDEPPFDDPDDPGPPLVQEEQVSLEIIEGSPELMDAIQEAELEDYEKPDEKLKAAGHGRRGHLSWENAEIFLHCHSTLQVGESCPRCHQGTLYQYKTSGVWVRFVGQAPLAPEVHKLERLRCSSCMEVFTATPPEELRQNPYATPEARAVAALIKYQGATPYNRFADLQKSFGQPLPRTRIWTMAQEQAEALRPPLEVMKELAAQGDLVQNDDTSVIILKLIQENKMAEAAGKPLERTGMFTTGIISQVQGHKIYLFFSSRKHAGENLADLLDLRETTHSPPTQVCDASDMNTKLGDHITEVGGCHDHARRKFYEILSSFPKSCGYALSEWKKIYHADQIAKEKNLNPEDRMLLHQKQSQPALKRLKAWSLKTIKDKCVDPRGHLAKAMKYFINNYKELTLFLRKPGVPISNCSVEQALKMPIGVRKMAGFYKTEVGAEVSDIIFSFIATCLAAKVNVFDYFVAVQNHSVEVKRAPELWLPWNYQEQFVKA